MQLRKLEKPAELCVYSCSFLHLLIYFQKLKEEENYINILPLFIYNDRKKKKGEKKRTLLRNWCIYRCRDNFVYFGRSLKKLKRLKENKAENRMSLFTIQ